MSTTLIPEAPVQDVAIDSKGSKLTSGPDGNGQLKEPATVPPISSEVVNELIYSVLGKPIPPIAEPKGSRGDTRDRNDSSSSALQSEGERWLDSLKEDDRIRVEEGIESILKGSIALAAKKCYLAAVKERRAMEGTHLDESPEVRQQQTRNSPPRNREADTLRARPLTQNARNRELETSTAGSRDYAGSDYSSASQRRANDVGREADIRTRSNFTYDRDRRRQNSPGHERSGSYTYASRDRLYGNNHGPQHLPHENFRGPGHVGTHAPFYGYDNRHTTRDTLMPPPIHQHYGSRNAIDDENRYRPPPFYSSDYRYPGDSRSREGDWYRHHRSPNRDHPTGENGDRGSRDENDDARRQRDKSSIRSHSSSATGAGQNRSGAERRRASERDELDRNSASRERRSRDRNGRGRTPSPPNRGDRVDIRPSDQSELHHRAPGENDEKRRPPSPHSDTRGSVGDGYNDAKRRSRSSRGDDIDARKERSGSDRRGLNGRDHRHGDSARGDDDKRREDGGHNERNGQLERASDSDREPVDDRSPRSRKTSRRKRHRSRRSRSRSRSSSSEGGRHRKSSRRKARRGRDDSSHDNSSDDDESERRFNRKHRHHRSRRRRHRSRSESDDESHVRKRSKKKRKERRKHDGEDRKRSDGEKKESGRDREESDSKKD